MKGENSKHKIVLLGDSSVGKTSIVNQYVFNSCSPSYQATIGVDFFSRDVAIGEGTVRLQIWDTAGQEKFRSLVPAYVRDSTVALLVYDIAARETFDALHTWYQMILNETNSSIIVIGNKIDLETERQVSREEGEKYAKQIGAEFIETSARTAVNITDMFLEAAALPIPPAFRPVETVELPAENRETLAGETQQSRGCSC
jgi:Ras-related protein Rab-6A